MVCDGAGSRRTSRSTVRPPSTGTTWMSALATSVVAISARRRSSTLERLNGSPLLNRAMVATWRALNGGRPVTRITPKCAIGPGIDRQRQRREMGLVIDLDVLVADPGAGEPFLAEQPGQLDPARDHVLGDHRVAGLHGERVAEALRRPRPPLRGRAARPTRSDIAGQARR